MTGPDGTNTALGGSSSQSLRGGREVWKHESAPGPQLTLQHRMESTDIPQGRARATFILSPEEILSGLPTRFGQWKWFVPIQAGARGRLATAPARRSWGVAKSWGRGQWLQGAGRELGRGGFASFPPRGQVVHRSRNKWLMEAEDKTACNPKLRKSPSLVV